MHPSARCGESECVAHLLNECAVVHERVCKCVAGEREKHDVDEHNA
jgi:hypothetical protein